MDWIVSLATFVSMALIARKMWQGWVVGLGNQTLWLYLIFTRDGLYGLLPLAAGLTALYVWALWEWTAKLRHRTTLSPETDAGDVVCVPVEDGPDRLFRQVTSVVVERHPQTLEPVLFRVLTEEQTVFGDRAEIINVLVPEECFTTA